MQKVIEDIANALRLKESLSHAELDKIIRRHSKRAHDGRRIFAKKNILPYYLRIREENGRAWHDLAIDDELDSRIVRTLQMKPRRTASGVATITVITKPWTCSNDCIYCPCDIRMPKSYLHDEPACQRAERNFFDPYLQTAARLRTLSHMGHETDKIELIVLGGTWTDYPAAYRTWFVAELFRALNDSESARVETVRERVEAYVEAGVDNDPEALESRTRRLQSQIDEIGGNSNKRTFNQCINDLYFDDDAWRTVSAFQSASFEELAALHRANETSAHRVVGLVVETRPDAITCDSLEELRKLGCTKVQMGIQSIDEELLKANGRTITCDRIREAFDLCRLYGFKTHAHFMVNLFGATPESDKRDYRTFVTDPAYRPDEVKLYPCALVAGTELVSRFNEGSWRPYSEEELIDVLSADMLATPPHTRVSRMIRDISAKDILVGNKKTNLRQMVERNLETRRDNVDEIRFREISTGEIDLDTLVLDEFQYGTTSSTEHFLQWVTPDGRIAGFLRLSLPHVDAVARHRGLPIDEGQAMIREVHVYGFATKIDSSGSSAQHHGLGRALIERACEIARDAGYSSINVISAIGTRDYYRRQDFKDAGLYQRKPLL